MELKRKTFRIKFEINNLIFEGKIEEFDYSEIIEFIKDSLTKNSQKELNIDISDLEYLNSSGLKFLLQIIIDSKEINSITIDENKMWQKGGISQSIPKIKNGFKIYKKSSPKGNSNE